MWVSSREHIIQKILSSSFDRTIGAGGQSAGINTAVAGQKKDRHGAPLGGDP
jgi:hypothetical protein